ncbi:MAG: hypothetical protein JWP79_3454, partial [Polaromonas sp.]|nr:hypothetical protein [Polaromonas sp.]
RIDAAALSEFAQRYIPERPAYPKTIHILEALPMTAIGKLFKPAMRTLAAQAVLQERLARHALNDDVTVEVTLEGKDQVARFTASGGSDVASRLRDMMQGFPLKYRIEARSPAGAGARP